MNVSPQQLSSRPSYIFSPLEPVIGMQGRWYFGRRGLKWRPAVYVPIYVPGGTKIRFPIIPMSRFGRYSAPGVLYNLSHHLQRWLAGWSLEVFQVMHTPAYPPNDIAFQVPELFFSWSGVFVPRVPLVVDVSEGRVVPTTGQRVGTRIALH